jgi:hypothetical protein
MIGRNHVGPELFDIRVDRSADSVATGKLMDLRRRGDRHFRRFLRERLQEGECRDIHRARPGDPAIDQRERPGDRLPVLVVIDHVRALALDELDAERVQELRQIAHPPKFAVGDGMEADLLLQLDDLAYAAILEPAQLLARGLSRHEIAPRLDQPLRPDQAADMVGAERRRGSFHQGFPSSMRRIIPVPAITETRSGSSP